MSKEKTTCCDSLIVTIFLVIFFAQNPRYHKNRLRMIFFIMSTINSSQSEMTHSRKLTKYIKNKLKKRINSKPSLILIEPRTWDNKTLRTQRPENSRTVFPGRNTRKRDLRDPFHLLAVLEGFHSSDSWQCHSCYLDVILPLPSWVVLLTHLGTPPMFSGVWRHLIN